MKYLRFSSMWLYLKQPSIVYIISISWKISFAFVLWTFVRDSKKFSLCELSRIIRTIIWWVSTDSRISSLSKFYYSSYTVLYVQSSAIMKNFIILAEFRGNNRAQRVERIINAWHVHRIETRRLDTRTVRSNSHCSRNWPSSCWGVLFSKIICH